MQVGAPCGSRAQEGRVAFLPRHVAARVLAGRDVVAEAGAGAARPWLAHGLVCVGGGLILEEAARCQQRPLAPAGQWLGRQGA